MLTMHKILKLSRKKKIALFPLSATCDSMVTVSESGKLYVCQEHLQVVLIDVVTHPKYKENSSIELSEYTGFLSIVLECGRVLRCLAPSCKHDTRVYHKKFIFAGAICQAVLTLKSIYWCWVYVGVDFPVNRISWHD